MTRESSGDKSLANNTPTTLPPITSASGTLATQTPSTTLSKRQKKVNIDVRRKQNRDAAARHRQRQQSRLDELTFKEAVLRQRVTELKSEINALKTAREGQQTAQYDTFTAALLSTMEAVDVLQANLLQASHDSLQLITDIQDVAKSFLQNQQEQNLQNRHQEQAQAQAQEQEQEQDRQNADEQDPPR
ncbi:hypothetical protein BX070DRAFT_236903 [Coemansia spiralis]|nr:hypothetical protein BX070DRAFT_236903 [Coemansia spiralis]